MPIRVTQVAVEVVIPWVSGISTAGVGLQAVASSAAGINKTSTAAVGINLGVSASDSCVFVETASAQFSLIPSPRLSASFRTSIGQITLSATAQSFGTKRVFCSVGLSLLATSSSRTNPVRVSLAPGISFSVSTSLKRAFIAPVSTTMRLTALASSRTNNPAVSSIVNFSLRTSTGSPRNGVSSVGIRLIPTVSAGRPRLVVCSSGLLLSAAPSVKRIEVSSGVRLTAIVRAFSNQKPSSTINIAATVSAFVSIPPGGIAPGGSGVGATRVIRSDVDTDFPMCFTRTPDGLVLMANGVNTVLRWDGFSTGATPVGIFPPETPVSISSSGTGMISGTYYAYSRFVDSKGNVSNLSPLSPVISIGSAGFIEQLQKYDPPEETQVVVGGRPQPSFSRTSIILDGATTTTIVSGDDITGVSVGDQIFLEGIDEEAVQNLGGSIPYTVLHVSGKQMRIGTPSSIRGTYSGGATWVKGAAQVSYSDVPTVSDTRIVRRQILRNTNGQLGVFYVDVDTEDMNSTSFTSTRVDSELRLRTPVPLFSLSGLPFANRHLPPPSTKLAIVSHLGRMFMAGEVSYTRGHIEATFGSIVISGVGTNWPESFAGRYIYIPGSDKGYEIASIDRANQTATLTEGLKFSPAQQSSYSIRPQPGERRLIYYTESGLPESWPPWNALSVQENDDEIVGLMVLGTFLFIIERRNMHRFTFQADPAVNSAVFPSVRRGCVNNRCWVVVEDGAYMLDESGVHFFDGSTSQSVSDEIQDLFRPGETVSALRVNWNASSILWHASHDPSSDTIRWFVSMSGDRDPRHALCFDYRRRRWWLEEYGFAITSSTTLNSGFRRSIAGSEARRFLALSDGQTDLVSTGDGARGKVSSASALTLTDLSASFASTLAGAEVHIVDGTGSLQSRKIAKSSSTTLTVLTPWTIKPTPGSTYQVGGVPWRWRSKNFRLSENDESNAQDFEVFFQPTTVDTNMFVEFYYDFSRSAREFGYSQSQDGVTTDRGDTAVSIDLSRSSGFAMQRMDKHREIMAQGDRHVSVLMAGVQSTEQVRIYQVIVNGAE